MTSRILVVDPSEDGLTILEFLQKRIPAAPPTYLRKLVKKEKILSKNGILEENCRLESGDEIILPGNNLLHELLEASEDMPEKPCILLESREILIVDKPAGLAVHTSQGHEKNNLAARVAALLSHRGQTFRSAPVHRLDAATSGPVLFAKGKKACSELGRLFMDGAVEKVYLALAAGRTAPEGQLISRVPAKGKMKEALTSYRALSQTDEASLLELQLHSGRQHQIRRQLADSGHPLFGDRRYDGPCPPDLPRLFLHCSHLAFSDPFRGEKICIDSPLPEPLASFLGSMGLSQG